MRVLHIVRRYGPIGGMENYVWNLTHELCRLGVEVEILCQSIEGKVNPLISTHRVSPSSQRRRWKAMGDFRSKCENFWRSYSEKCDILVHSHERCSFHHVTTFHGPPMPIIGELSWYKRMSPRVRAWCRWEKEEVTGSNVTIVAPVSNRIGKMLIERYPGSEAMIRGPFYPGINNDEPAHFQAVTRELKLIFVGVEWKRKGLEMAIGVAGSLRKYYPNLTLDLFGPPSKSISFLAQQSWIQCHGWVPKPPYSRYHLLIHPAIDEPFGMVVIEALASGCRVIASECVGAGELSHRAMRVVDRDRGVDEWASEAHNLISEDLGAGYPETLPTWDVLAQSYLGAYSEIIHSRNGD